MARSLNFGVKISITASVLRLGFGSNLRVLYTSKGLSDGENDERRRRLSVTRKT
jgi:hypothetical protein